MDFFKRNWYWIIPVIIFAIIGVMIYTEKKKTAKPKVGIGESGNTGINPLNNTVVLYNGISGYKKEVARLQDLINNCSKYKGEKLSVDGVFGEKTAVALKAISGKWEISLSGFKC